MSSPALCLDIIYVVLGFLHGDKTTLMASSLACKAWLPVCRRHLFKKITLSPPRVLEFLVHVDSTSSNIASFVNHLVVQQTWRLGGYRILHDPPKTNRLALHLQGLKCLTLSELEWAAVPSEVQQLLTGIESVNILNFYRVNFKTMEQSIEYICSFPALETLALKGWGMHLPDSQLSIDALSTVGRLPHIKPLHICIGLLNLDQPKSVFFVHYIMRQDPLPVVQLDTLRLGPLHDHALLAMPYIRDFLRLSGPSLNQLQVRAPHSPYNASLRDGTCCSLGNNTF